MRLGQQFYRLLLGQGLANLADTCFILTLVVYVQEQTGSAILTGLIPVMRVAALFVSGIFASVILTRFPQMKVMQTSLMAEAFFLLLIAIFYRELVQGSGLALLLALLFGIGFARGWSGPVKQALLPRLVAPDLLVRANSLLATSDQTIQMAAWAIGGVLIVLIGWTSSFWLPVVIMAGAISVLAMIRVEEAPQEEARPAESKRAAFQAGWKAIWASPVLRLVTAMDLIEGVANGVWVGALISVYVIDVLHKGTEWFGFINASYFFGTVAGGLLVLAFSRFVQPRLLSSMMAGSFSLALMTAGFALTSSPTVALLLCVIMGPAFQLRDIAESTIFQRQVRPAELTTVYAAHGALTSVVFGVSVLIMGVIADTFGIRVTYLAAGGMYLLSGVIALFIRSSVKGLGGPAEPSRP